MKSFPKIGEHTIAGYSQEVLANLDRLGVGDSDLLGYSNNSEVIVHIALTRPERIRSLILIEPALFTDRSVYEERIRLFEAGDIDGSLRTTFRFASPGMTEKELEQAVNSAKEFYGGDYSSLIGEFKARCNYKVEDYHLEHLTIPTLIIGAGKSIIKDQVLRAARVIPDASLMWIRHADHYLVGAEDALFKIVEAFKVTLE